MTQTPIQILIVDQKPTAPNIEPSALYLVKPPGSEVGRMYKANKTGTAVIPFFDTEAANSALTYRGASMPSEGSGYMWWFDGTVMYYNAIENGVDNWIRLWSQMPTWLNGGLTPTTGIGVDGDMYLKNNGDIFRKDYGEWIYLTSITTLPGAIRVIEASEVDGLANEEGVDKEFLLIRGMGLYVHENENFNDIDGNRYIGSLNGRWSIEAVSAASIENILADTIQGFVDSNGTLPSSAPLKEALDAYVDMRIGEREIRGTFTPPFTTIENESFQVEVQGARAGDFVLVSPNHALNAYTVINATCFVDNEIQINVSHLSGSISITNFWSYLIFKR